MALYINDKNEVEVILPPKELTEQEKEILENTPVNTKLINEAMAMEFVVVYE